MDRLEIIDPNGKIIFYDLPVKGITNIGRHPENNIVLDSPGLAPFYAMLDHRQKPYQIMLLVPGETALVGDEPLLPNVSKALHHRTHIRIDRYTIVLVEDGGQHRPAPGMMGAIQPPAPLPTTPANLPPPTTRPETSAGPYNHTFAPQPSQAALPPQPPGVLPPTSGPGYIDAMPPPRPVAAANGPMADKEDEVIITELAENEWTVDVDQIVTGQLTIINGGQLVAAFTVAIQGLDESWVHISQSYINLNEGERATITFSISPPRLPTSVAGVHRFAVIVTSPNHPGRMSQRGATLIINPYYEFMVGELTPRRQTISWFKHFGKVTVPITNLGNSKTPFRLEGKDEEQACSFEFDVPGELVPLATQAELRLQPEESISIPIAITPRSRRLIGVRKRRYSYTITSTLSEGQLAPRSMLGELSHKAFVGPWVLLLMVFLLAILILILIRPRLYNFMLTDGGRVARISNETPVAIRWNAFYLTNLAIDPEIEGLELPMSRQGTVVAYPKADTTYNLSGGNFLSRLAPSIFAPPTKSIEVQVVPIAPKVTFEALPVQVVGGEEIELSWQVQNADNIQLFRQVGDSGPQELMGDYSGQPRQILRITPEPNQVGNIYYILVANNAYVLTPTPVPQRVAVLTPSPTVPPTPAIVLFSANPQVINQGEVSILSLLVDGVEEVILQDPGGAQSVQPSNASLEISPAASGKYTLIVQGTGPRSVQINVIPATATPTATPVPEAPVIELFAASSSQLIQGKATPADDEKTVVLSWKVRGTVTNVELNAGADLGIFSNLDPEGSLPVTINKNTSFVLTAFNEDKASSGNLQVEVVEATPTPVPADTPVPTETTLPTAVINSFAIVSPDPPQVVSLGSNTYQVYVDTQVRFRWQVDSSAKKVRLESPDGDAQTLSAVPIGSFDKDIAKNGDGEYRLVAINGADAESPAQVLTVQVVDKPPPNRPTNVTGAEDTANNVNTITWSWQSDSTLSDLTGFRVYRADVSDGIFSPLPGQLAPPGSSGSWTDTLTAPDTTCGKAYYVVSVYENIAGDELVTDASTNTWFSTPCP